MVRRSATRPVDDVDHSYDLDHACQVAAGPYVARVAGVNDYSWGVEDSDWPALFDGSNSAAVRVRVSVTAAAGALVSVVGLCTVLTGLLAGAGLVVAAVGLLMSLAGLVTANRPARIGSGLAGLGILCSLAAIVLAVAALTGVFGWPNSHSDEIGRMHTWLVTHLAWLHNQFYLMTL
jgi:hypothetical protein